MFRTPLLLAANADFSRLMRLILPTLTVNSLRKRLRIRMLKGQCFPRRCNNNSQAGPTIVQLQVSEMQGEVSRTPRLWEAYSNECTPCIPKDVTDDYDCIDQACYCRAVQALCFWREGDLAGIAQIQRSVGIETCGYRPLKQDLVLARGEMFRETVVTDASFACGGLRT